VVVGGGLAGMSAALAAADTGGRVILVERRGALGGDARFFGTVGDQEAPEATIARLSEKIGAAPTITVLTFADAFAMSGNRVRVHQVAVEAERLAPRVVTLEAKQIVLATGAAERLPVFPGNRAPGITGAVAAFNRAQHYGVWPGKRAVFATPNNFAYRLALLAVDAGIEVQRVADSRPTPQSRFIDFCKASGITLATGLGRARPSRGATRSRCVSRLPYR
jgi:sarcosine oxidase, subunit alpha